MATTPYTKVSSASIAGLVTDGNALMTTEQSNLDETNYELLRDGTRRRRRPILQELSDVQNGNYFRSSVDDSLRSTYLWKTPAFKDNYSIVVEEIDGEIRFYSIDHNSPTYVRDNELDQDRLRLELWGDRLVFAAGADAQAAYYADIAAPCTYTEGNGSLYIFNSRAGTIKVELLDSGRLRMSAIGTWVRDYLGAVEEVELDYRQPRTGDTDTWSTGFGFKDPDETVLITEDLDSARAYNLSNTGWDAKAVSEFMIQSDQDYTVRDPSSVYVSDDASVSELTTVVNGTLIAVRTVIDNPSLWPATTDRYLAGRQVDEKGVNQFSFSQLVQAKENKSMPPRGARINTSQHGPSGTFVGCPSNLGNSTTSVLDSAGGRTRLSTTFGNRQSHYDGNNTLQSAIFIHAMSFTVEKDGRTYQGGFSGMRTLASISADGLTVEFDYWNPILSDYTNWVTEEMYVHSSPEYFPHALYGHAGGHDYRSKGRRPQAGSFFSGRLWQTSDSHNRVYYSQIVQVSTGESAARGMNVESMCYSVADPTDGDDNALVPTDGGYINTSDSGTHYGLVALGDSLLLLTDRGIWAIRPGTGGVFSATNYTFTKVVGAEVLGPEAYVSTGDQVHVATEEGILALALQSTSFGNTTVTVSRMLDNRLMKGYEDIVSTWSRPTGKYDPETRTVRWLFRPSEAADWPTEEQPVLSLSLYHNAWYKYTLGTQCKVIDMAVWPYSSTTETYNKFRYLVTLDIPTEPGLVTSDWGVEVNFSPTGEAEWIKNWIGEDEKFADYRPLYPYTGVRDPIDAFMLTNHMLPGQGINWSQINYIVTHNRNVTESWVDNGDGTASASMEGGTLLSIRWDWMDQFSTGKWDNPYQTYKYRRSYLPAGPTESNTFGEPVLVHKMKLRGRGREFRLYFESDGHKDSHIEGWAYQGYILNGV